MSSAPTSISDSFEFIKSIVSEPSKIDYAKMTILLSFQKYGNTEHFQKCRLIQNKFEERYGGNWVVSVIKPNEGAIFASYKSNYINVIYKNFYYIIFDY